MNRYPIIEVSLTVEGIDLNLEELTKKIDINPTEIRDISEWPKVIKRNKNLP